MTARRALLVAMAMIVAAATPAAVASAASGPPEAAVSPHTRTDPAGDCKGSGVRGGPRCDLLQIKVVNKAANVKLIATYASTPFFPVVSSPNIRGSLAWHLEGSTDREVRIARSQGTLYATVFEDPYVGGPPVCWSGDGGLPAPIVDGNRVIVTVPRACLGDLTTVRLYALVNRLTQSMAEFATDRAPNSGYTARIAVGT